MENKRQELKKYSDFEKVKEKAKKLGLNPVGISSKKDKKYMIFDKNGDVKHFGQMLYQDFTKHEDESKREAFRNRNWRWEHADKYSPAYLAYHLLWQCIYINCIKIYLLYTLNMMPLFVLIQKIENGKLIKSIRSINIELVERDGFKLVYNKKYKLYIKGVNRMIRIR